jgi:hypothetical protein
LANLLRLSDEMAEGQPGDVPDGSEILAGDGLRLSPPAEVAATRRSPQPSTIG